MVGETESRLFEISIPNKALNLLSGLKRTPVGEAVHKHVEQLLRDSEATHVEVEQAYAGLLSVVLNAYALYLPQDSILRTHLKLITLRLTPPLSPVELKALRQYIDLCAKQVPVRDEAANNVLDNVFAPLLEGFGGPAAPKPVAQPVVAPAPSPIAANSPVAPVMSVPPPAPPVTSVARAMEVVDAAPRVAPATDPRVDVAYRQHLNEKRKTIITIQDSLGEHVAETVRQTEEYGAHLEIELGRLQRAGNIQALEVLRQALINETQNLLRYNRGLAQRLEGVSKSLLQSRTDSEKLTDELTRVHLLSLTDELTKLANRRAFTQRLDDEVGRVQRYGNHLSLAILDLDEFKAVNDQHGHLAGDEALRSFADNILSIFRHHDMVARYGGEEFAVILPNTDTEGAMSALRKVQKRALETHYQHNGLVMPMPTFSAGLAVYRSGETPANLIARADSALFRAKRQGRNRLEIDTSPAQPQAV